MVSIVIMTRNRPAFLRDALESIRQQTARDAISQVIVSENGTTEESRAVCKEFSDLPINYIQQRPPVRPLLHLQVIQSHVKQQVLAILHDDDWWASNHLQAALELLSSSDKYVAVMSNAYNTAGPEYPQSILDSQWWVWVAGGCDFRPIALVLDPVSVTLASLVRASLHFSTYVMRFPAFKSAYQRLVATNNNYDIDRSFPILLADHGNIAYLTRPDVFIRRHSGQDQFQPLYLTGCEELTNTTTRWLLQNEAAKVMHAVEKFNRMVPSLAPDVLTLLSSQTGASVRKCLVEECGMKLSGDVALPASPPKDLKWFLKQLCPPAVLALKRRLIH